MRKTSVFLWAALATGIAISDAKTTEKTATLSHEEVMAYCSAVENRSQLIVGNEDICVEASPDGGKTWVPLSVLLLGGGVLLTGAAAWAGLILRKKWKERSPKNNERIERIEPIRAPEPAEMPLAVEPENATPVEAEPVIVALETPETSAEETHEANPTEPPTPELPPSTPIAPNVTYRVMDRPRLGKSLKPLDFSVTADAPMAQMDNIPAFLIKRGGSNQTPAIPTPEVSLPRQAESTNEGINWNRLRLGKDIVVLGKEKWVFTGNGQWRKITGTDPKPVYRNTDEIKKTWEWSCYESND